MNNVHPIFASILASVAPDVKGKDKYDEIAMKLFHPYESDPVGKCDSDNADILREAFFDRDECDKWRQIAEDWATSADRAQQPEKFYKGYNESTMSAMQAIMTKAQDELHLARLEIEARKQECQTLTKKRDKAEAKAKAFKEALQVIVLEDDKGTFIDPRYLASIARNALRRIIE